VGQRGKTLSTVCPVIPQDSARITVSVVAQPVAVLEPRATGLLVVAAAAVVAVMQAHPLVALGRLVKATTVVRVHRLALVVVVVGQALSALTQPAT